MNRRLLLTSTFFVIYIVYFFSVSAWVGIQSFSNLIQRWSHRSELSVYLRPEIKSDEIQEVKNYLTQFNSQLTIQFQSTDDIRKALMQLMPKSQYDFSSNDDLVAAIPPHFIIKGTSSLWGDSLFEVFARISNELAKNRNVESTSYGKSWAEKYLALIDSFNGATMMFLIGLGLTLTLVIGNSIRSHINSQREEIEILELVGATPKMIRKPYLFEGAGLSFFAMFLALSTVSLITVLVKNAQIDMMRMLDLKSTLLNLTLVEWTLSLALSIAIGLVGSYFCLVEINNGWAASGHSPSFLRIKGWLRSPKGHVNAK